jgi:hypothetical protein
MCHVPNSWIRWYCADPVMNDCKPSLIGGKYVTREQCMNSIQCNNANPGCFLPDNPPRTYGTADGNSDEVTVRWPPLGSSERDKSIASPRVPYATGPYVVQQYPVRPEFYHQ